MKLHSITKINEGAIKEWDKEGSGGMRNYRDGKGSEKKAQCEEESHYGNRREEMIEHLKIIFQ